MVYIVTKNKKELADGVTPVIQNTDGTDNTNTKNDNLSLYNQMRIVPPEAQKQITGGRLNGFTDINPMWRIKTLTEQFGPAGVGWYYDIVKIWTESGANDEIAAFVMIDLYIRHSDEWSKPIKGIGGSSFVSNESKGLYTSDEAYKMALTDALSVACKALGVAADVYFAKDRTKYTATGNTANPTAPPENPDTGDISKGLSVKQINRLYAISKQANVTDDTLKRLLMKHYNKGVPKDLTRSEYDFICSQLQAMIDKPA